MNLYEKMRQQREDTQYDTMLNSLPDDPVEQKAAPKEAPGMTSSIATGVAKGVNMANRNIADGMLSLDNWIAKNVVDLRTDWKRNEAKQRELDGRKATAALQTGVDYWNDGSTANEITANITEFLYGFAPALKAERAITGTKAVLETAKAGLGKRLQAHAVDGAVAGAVASATTVTPDTANLSQLVNEHLPSLSNPITRYLQVDPADGEGEKRLKQALDSVLTGVVAAPIIEGLGAAIKSFKSKKIAEGVEPKAIADEYGAANDAAYKQGETVPAKEVDAAGNDAVFNQPKTTLETLEERFNDRTLFTKIRSHPNLGSEAVGDILRTLKTAQNDTLPKNIRDDAEQKLAEFFDALDNQPNWTTPKPKEPTTAIATVGKQGGDLAVPSVVDDAIEGQATRIAGDLPSNNFKQLSAPEIRALPAPQQVAYKKQAEAVYEQEFQDLLKAEQLGKTEDVLQSMHKSLQEKEARLAELNEILSSNTKAASTATRGKLLDDTLAAIPAGGNPKRAFDKALKDGGITDTVFTKAEQDKIDKFLELRGVLDEANKPLKASPNEMDAAGLGIKEKKSKLIPAKRISQEVDAILEAADGKTGVVTVKQDTELAKLVPEGTTITKEELVGVQQAFKGQAGFVDSEMLARIFFGSTKGEAASSIAGGVAGGMSADWSDPKNALAMVALGSIGGRALFRMKTPQEITQLRKEAPVTTTLAVREGLEGIRPKQFNAAAKGMRLNSENIAGLAKRVRDGNYKNITPEELGSMPGLIRNIDSEADIKQILTDTYTSIYGSTVRSWDEVVANSESLKSMGSVTALFERTKNLDAGVHAARTVLTASAADLKALAMKVSNLEQGLGNTKFVTAEERGAAIDAAVLAFEKATKTHAALAAQVFGSSSEVGRALSAHRMLVKEEKLLANDLRTMVEASGGRSKLAKIAKALDGIDGPAEITEAVQLGLMARLGNAALYTRLTGLLWSPVTQSKNIIGSILKGLMLTGENYIEAGIAKVFRSDAVDRMTFEQANEFAYGFYAGFGDAISYIRREGISLKGGDLISQEKLGKDFFKQVAGSKDFNATYHNTNAADAGYGHTLGNNPWGDLVRNPTSEFGQNVQKGLDYFGALQGANLSFMGATDSFFQALNFRASMHSQAMRLARADGLSGDALVSRIEQLVRSPSQEMVEKGMGDALDATFQRALDPSSGAWLDKMGHAVNSARHNIKAISLLTPFVKTPTNIMRDVLDRVPLLNSVPVLSGIAAQNQMILKAGGAEADKLIARWAMGGTLMMGASILSYNGMLIGGMEQDKDGLKNLSNLQQYSLKIGDKTYSINGIDPIGMFLGLSADITEALRNGKDETALSYLATGMTALSRNLLSKSYMTGLFDFFEMINDVAKKPTGQGVATFEKWLAKQSTTFMPFGGSMKMAESQIDPVIRDYNDWKDRWIAATPFASEGLYAKRNVLSGEPIKNEGAWGPDVLSPFYSKTEDKSPIVQELVRMNMAVDPVDKILSGKKSLSPEQYDRIQVLATQEVKIRGMSMKESLNELVKSERYQRMPDAVDGFTGLSGTKQHTIRTIIGQYRTMAEKALVREDDEYAQKYKDNLINKLRVKRGEAIIPTK